MTRREGREFSTNVLCKRKWVSNLALLHALVYQSHEGAPNRLLPPLTPDTTLIHDPVPSMVVPAYSKAYINRNLNILHFIIYLHANSLYAICFFRFAS